MIDFENAIKITNDSSRVIGLKNADLEKLYNASLNKESSFGVVNEAKVIPDNNLTVPNESVMEDSNKVEMNVNSTINEDVNVFDKLEEEPVVEDQAPDVFSQVPPVINNITVNDELNNDVSTHSFDTPSIDPIYTNEAPINEPLLNKEENSSVALDTPQTFFDREEINDGMIDDPALIIVDNLKKLIEDKNSMINALNEKINVLENKNEILNEQLMKSEEARKVSEAQTLAAHTALENARKEQEVPVGSTPDIQGGSTPDMTNDNVKVLQPQQFQNPSGNIAA